MSQILSRVFAVSIKSILTILSIAILAFSIELFARGSFYQALEFFSSSDLFYLVPAFVLPTALLLFVYSIVGRLNASAIVLLIVLAIVGTISRILVIETNQPLCPWDLYAARESIGIFSWGYYPFTSRQSFYYSGFLLGSVCLFWFLPRLKLRWYLRPFPFCISIGVFLLIAFHQKNFLKEYIQAGKFIHQWELTESYQTGGFLFSNTLQSYSMFIEKPKQYSKEKIQRIISQHIDKKGSETEKQTPNIILILNESFWDPTQLKKISFKEDPIKTFHKIEQEHTFFDFLSPVMGGTTCNVEAEFFTGLNLTYLPKWSIPFEMYIQRPVPSLMWELQSKMNSVTAIHPNERWFWNRKMVYPLIGFKEFVGLKQMRHKDSSAHYVDDTSLADEAISRAKNFKSPFFLFLLTIENHGPYSATRYKNKEDLVQIEEDVLSKDERAALETYLIGLKHADMMLEKIIEYFSSIEHPTVVIFFGDHLPPLRSVFKSGGYVPRPDIRTNRGIIWRNYKEEGGKDLGLVGASFFTPLILSELELPMSPFFSFISDMRKDYPAFVKGRVVKANKKTHNFRELREKDSRFYDYETLQYDILFGENYLAEIAK